MIFPEYLHFFGLQIHEHLFFEAIAYSLGFYLYRREKKKWTGPRISWEQNLWLIASCLVGALIGAKVLAWVESPQLYWPIQFDLHSWAQGKTIVGGLLGGWMGVEIAKKFLGIRFSTGDVYVFPLIIGIGIGRIGCFFAGMEDGTYGIPTSLPWGVDFGDGIPRHPTQIYEIIFLALLGLVLLWRKQTPHPLGRLFRLFMLSYLTFRFFSEFIKPQFIWFFGLDAIQVACLAGMAYAVWLLQNDKVNPPTPAAHV